MATKTSIPFILPRQHKGTMGDWKQRLTSLHVTQAEPSEVSREGERLPGQELSGNMKNLRFVWRSVKLRPEPLVSEARV